MALPTCYWRKMRHRPLYHVSRILVDTFYMEPSIYDDRTSDGVEHTENRICLTSDPLAGANAIIRLREVEVARLSGFPFFDMHVYLPNLHDLSCIVTWEQLMYHHAVYDIPITKEHWLITTNGVRMNYLHTLRIDTALTERGLTIYDQFGDRTMSTQCSVWPVKSESTVRRPPKKTLLLRGAGNVVADMPKFDKPNKDETRITVLGGLVVDYIATNEINTDISIRYASRYSRVPGTTDILPPGCASMNPLIESVVSIDELEEYSLSDRALVLVLVEVDLVNVVLQTDCTGVVEVDAIPDFTNVLCTKTVKVDIDPAGRTLENGHIVPVLSIQ